MRTPRPVGSPGGHRVLQVLDQLAGRRLTQPHEKRHLHGRVDRVIVVEAGQPKLRLRRVEGAISRAASARLFSATAWLRRDSAASWRRSTVSSRMASALMDLKTWAAVAGVGGLALAAATYVFRDIIARDVFSKMPARLTYQLLRLIVVCAFALGVIGVSGWIWLQSISQARASSKEYVIGTLDYTIHQVYRIVASNRMFVTPILNDACSDMTEGKWIVAQKEMRRVHDSF